MAEAGNEARELFFSKNNSSAILWNNQGKPAEHQLIFYTVEMNVCGFPSFLP